MRYDLFKIWAYIKQEKSFNYTKVIGDLARMQLNGYYHSRINHINGLSIM